jgi:hypothetical protein
MRITSITDAGSGEMNEDNFLIKDDLFAVFDGLTGLQKYKSREGKTGGFIAAEIAKKVFERNDKPLAELAKEANAGIRKAMVEKGINVSDKLGLWGTAMAAVKIGNDSLDWLQIGDTNILLIRDGSFRLLADDYDHDIESLMKWKDLAGKKKKNIRELIRDQLDATRKQSNVSYGVMNGEEEMAGFVRIGRESLEGIRHILIFSDGMIIPKKNPQDKDDLDTLVKLFLRGGMVEVKDYVRKLENDDPNCWEYPRLKQHDDLTAIAVSF